jgi:prevent-host-death family protein
MPRKADLQVNMHDAKTHLSKYVARAAAGETVVIAKGGKPLARLVPLEAEVAPRKSILGALAHVKAPDDETWRAMDKEIEDMFFEAAEKRW